MKYKAPRQVHDGEELFRGLCVLDIGAPHKTCVIDLAEPIRVSVEGEVTTLHLGRGGEVAVLGVLVVWMEEEGK
jgi:hypothetical protein